MLRTRALAYRWAKSSNAKPILFICLFVYVGVWGLSTHMAGWACWAISISQEQPWLMTDPASTVASSAGWLDRCCTPVSGVPQWGPMFLRYLKAYFIKKRRMSHLMYYANHFGTVIFWSIVSRGPSVHPLSPSSSPFSLLPSHPLLTQMTLWQQQIGRPGRGLRQKTREGPPFLFTYRYGYRFNIDTDRWR